MPGHQRNAKKRTTRLLSRQTISELSERVGKYCLGKRGRSFFLAGRLVRGCRTKFKYIYSSLRLYGAIRLSHLWPFFHRARLSISGVRFGGFLHRIKTSHYPGGKLRKNWNGRSLLRIVTIGMDQRKFVQTHSRIIITASYQWKRICMWFVFGVIWGFKGLDFKCG